MQKSILALLLGLSFTLGGCDVIDNLFGGGVVSHPPIGDISGGRGDSSSTSSTFDTTGGGGTEDDPCQEHKDADNDGICDDCKAGVVTTFDFYAINDIHGKIVENGSQPGVDEMTTYLKNAKENNPNTVILSSGDSWQGMAESNLTEGKIMTEWMNEVGFAAMTLGNHEFDWGEEAIAENAELANFPLLAINVYDSATGKRVDYAQPSVMIEQNGAKIGIIGAIGDCYSSISGEVSGGFTIKAGNRLTELVKEEAESLREQGADIIIYSLHDGHGESSVTSLSNDALARYYDISLSEGYVDLVFEGHSHQRYAFKDKKGVYHVQSAGENQGLSHAKVQINIANETYTMNKPSMISSSAYANLQDDPIVETLLNKYSSVVSKVNEELGYNKQIRYGMEICDKVAELYYELAQKTWGSRYDIVLGGAYLSTRSPYDLIAGNVKYRDVYDILPFDNAVVLCSVSGKNLQERFIDNKKYNWNEDKKYNVYYESLPSVNPNGTYYIVTDTYTSTYSLNGLTEIARFDNETFARDLLAEYIREGGYGTMPSNLPEANSTLTIPQAAALGQTFEQNTFTPYKYYVTGRIISIANTEYGNMTIGDANGNTLYIYGTYDATGATRYDAISNPPQVGDTVTLYGIIGYYNGRAEMKNGWIVESSASQGGSGNQGGNGGNGGGEVVPTTDPYANMTAEEFYANYTVATSSKDAEYRTLHNFMSGELTLPNESPTIANSRPQKNGKYIRNSQATLSADGLTYTVLDSEGYKAFEVYKTGAYITLEEVSAYVYAFGTYPKNYTAQKSDSLINDGEWGKWGQYLRLNHSTFTGDISSHPYEPALPNSNGVNGRLQYYEMDIGTTGTTCDLVNYPSAIYNTGTKITRGAARIVYAKNDLNKNGKYDIGELYLFYTYNHYNDFQEYLNYENGWGEKFGNISGGGAYGQYSETTPPTQYEGVYIGLLNGTGNFTLSYPTLSIVDALDIAVNLKDNYQTTYKFYLCGIVQSIENTQYGNVYISDGEGNKILVYGLYDKTGKIRYDAMQTKPVVGDTIVVYGVLKKYVNGKTGEVTLELANGWLQAIE